MSKLSQSTALGTQSDSCGPQSGSRGAITARSLRGLLIGGVVLLALAGCGRRGPLEPPPGAVNPQPDLTNLEPDEPRPFLPSVRPVGTGKKGKPINAPKDTFFLDPIL